MRSRDLLLLAVILFLWAACSGDRKPAPVAPRAESGAQPSPPQPGADAGGKGSLRIEPAEVYRGTPVRVSPDPSSPGGVAVEWLVNGEPVRGGGGPTLDTAALRKGNTIQARVAGAGGTLLSPVVTVRNSPPEIRGVRFIPGEGGQGSAIGVEAESYDADGDAVRFEILWGKNGEPAGAGARLAAAVKRGDKIDVTITPFDGEERGRSAVLSREVRNTPPVIEGQEQFQVDGNVVTFRVRAFDADGDPLTYAIVGAPAGMRIDGATGRVRWETAPGMTGRQPVSVKVSDGSGGEATARLTVTISQQPPSGDR